MMTDDEAATLLAMAEAISQPCTMFDAYPGDHAEPLRYVSLRSLARILSEVRHGTTIELELGRELGRVDRDAGGRPTPGHSPQDAHPTDISE
jgi:hypothetical protein